MENKHLEKFPLDLTEDFFFFFKQMLFFPLQRSVEENEAVARIFIHSFYREVGCVN